jgi:uncharacterized protein (DUF305 family)
MTTLQHRPRFATIAVCILWIAAAGATAACASAGATYAGAPPPAGVPALPAGDPPPDSPAARARADGGIPPYTDADVRFMQGMIGHHAQAVVMSSYAPKNAAGNDIRILAERIAVAQTDEMAFMRNWLQTRRQRVPDTSDPHAGHAGMTTPATGSAAPMMPGMLTAAQLTELSNATGPAFDRLFLRYMIQHHQGALAMLQELFSARGAGQDDDIFKFASDVSADQGTEIARMESMLKARERSPEL